MNRIYIFIILVFGFYLGFASPVFSQYDVTSFNPDNTWNNSIDPDTDTIWAYTGDCLKIPFYIYFIELPSMYSFVALVYVDTNLTIPKISLEQTVFGDRFNEPWYFSFDSTRNRYATMVSDSIFNPPYFPDSLVNVAYWIYAHLKMNSANSTVIGISDVILLDSTGYFVNTDQAGLRIIIRQLPFRRGDIDHDSLLTINDISFLLQYIYMSGPPPDPLSTGDVNRDCVIDIEDVLYLRNELSSGNLKGVGR